MSDELKKFARYVIGSIVIIFAVIFLLSLLSNK
jgi:hypothetical protein